MSLVHGGNVYEVASGLGCSPEAILDYSASINPLGPPHGLLQELNRSFPLVEHYPDIHNRRLVDALAAHHRISTDRIVVGNGSTELIYWLPRILDIEKAVVVLPTFSEYQKAFELQGVKLHKLVTSAESSFQPTREQLERTCEAVHPKAILFTHPGSPAGSLLSSEVRSWIVERSRKGGLFCLIDEVFVDFCEDNSFKKALEESFRTGPHSIDD